MTSSVGWAERSDAQHRWSLTRPHRPGETRASVASPGEFFDGASQRNGLDVGVRLRLTPTYALY
jgi:hypothetical protein